MSVEHLSGSINFDAFDSTSEPLNRFLKRFALTNEANGSSRTYVFCDAGRRVIGYYALCAGAVQYRQVPARTAKGLAKHEVPVLLLARLAVDRAHQGQGIGLMLLRDAIIRTTQAADIVGIRALLVHAKDDPARAWYAKFDFEPSPTDPLHLFLLLKDIRASLPRS